MTLAAAVQRHQRAIVATTALVAVFGIIASLGLTSSIYPRLEFPRVVIIGHSGTLPARTMMLTVTRPLEQAVMEVPGIRRVRSTTFRGATEISAQFEPRTDMIVALQQVQGKIDDAKPSLPGDTDLIVERLTPAAFPMFIVDLTGPVSSADLYDYAFFVMRPRLSRVPGAGRVEVTASDTREINVIVDPARLVSTGLTVHDVADRLLQRQSARTGGTAVDGRRAAAGPRFRVVAIGRSDRRHARRRSPGVRRPPA